MIDLIFATAFLGGLGGFVTQRAETLHVSSASSSPVVDGRVDTREYGSPNLHIQTAAGDVHVWVVRNGGFVYIAATIPDSTFYWGDDFVVSLDPDGSADSSPQTGDRQWYLRRTLDSSVVFSAANGRWETPGQATAVLGPLRHHAEWDVASSSSATGWNVELRIRESFVKPGAGTPRIAFRTANCEPCGWWSWPAPPAGTRAQRVERDPQLWIPLSLR